MQSDQKGIGKPIDKQEMQIEGSAQEAKGEVKDAIKGVVDRA